MKSAGGLLIDYDDAVAYLNGVEIGRSGLGANGETVPYDRPADVSHEARLVWRCSDIVEVDADLLVSGQVIWRFKFTTPVWIPVI